MSTPLLQHELVRETVLPCLHWRHPDTPLESELRERFGTEQISCGLEEFKQHVIRQLDKIGQQKPEKSSAAQSACDFIFIDAAPEDMHLTEKLMRCLQEYDFCDISVPLQDTRSALDAMRDLEENYREADIVLLLYHTASQAWVREHLLNCRKAQRKRSFPHHLIAVCQDRPENEKGIGITLRNLQVFYCPDLLAEPCLQTLVGQIKGKVQA
nr:hypothetical protein [Candidatus Electrothrix aestuarii]